MCKGVDCSPLIPWIGADVWEAGELKITAAQGEDVILQNAWCLWSKDSRFNHYCHSTTVAVVLTTGPNLLLTQLSLFKSQRQVDGVLLGWILPVRGTER